MADDAKIETRQRSSPWRPRFSLKWLLLVVAIFCVWLGFYTARDRRAREMVALNDAIVNAVEKNAEAEPANTSFTKLGSVRFRMGAFLKQTRLDTDARRQQILSFFGGGSLYGTNVMHVELNVRRALEAQSREKVVADLLTHYERGLGELGLKRAIGTQPGSFAHANFGPRTAIWQIPKNGVSVIIDVMLDPFTKTANVRVIFIQNEKLSIW